MRERGDENPGRRLAWDQLELTHGFRPADAADARHAPKRNTRIVAATIGLAVLAVAGVSACSSSSSSASSAPNTPDAPLGAIQTTTIPPTTASASTSTTTASPDAPTSTAASFPKLVLPAGPITQKNAPKADPGVVALIKASSNAEWNVNYLAVIDQAARTHDAAALDHLLGCAQRGGCKAEDSLWATPGVMDQIPVLLEKTTLVQDSGSVSAPELTLAFMEGAATAAHPGVAAEEKLFGISYPTEYRGLELYFGFSAPDAASARGYISWDNAALAEAPASTVRLASYSAGSITTKHAPKADPHYVTDIQTSLADGTSVDKHLPGTVNLLALIDEAAQLHDIDALVKLCGPCTGSPDDTARFVAALTATDHPYAMGRFDSIVTALRTQGMPDSGPGISYRGDLSAPDSNNLLFDINVDEGPTANGSGIWFPDFATR